MDYSQELWTLKNLHSHVQSHAEEVGYPRLASITKPMIQKILKMYDVLVVYKQVSMQFDEKGNIIIPKELMFHTISCDEKPGIQTIATTSEDLRPSEENGCVYRDYKYKRLSTLPLLAGIDLLAEQAKPVVSETHKSSDFHLSFKEVRRNVSGRGYHMDHL